MAQAQDAGVPQAREVAEQAAKPVRLLARIGLVAYGLVYLVVAGLIAQVALGESERADKKGALQEIAETSAGRTLLWVVVAGLAALVLLRLAEALLGHRGLRGRRRAGRIAVDVGEAAVYAVLARSAATIAQAEGGDSFSKSVVAKLFDLPGGPFLVGLVGCGARSRPAATRWCTAYAGRSCVTSPCPPACAVRSPCSARWAGSALGVAGGTAGLLLAAAAVQFDPSAPVGLDAGIRALADQPFGPGLLLLLAGGLAVFAVYCLFDARYRTE